MIEICETIEKHMRHGDSDWSWECTTGVLVRCKDCKHHHYDGHEIPYCDKSDYGYGWEDDDYCSYAERKEK